MRAILPERVDRKLLIDSVTRDENPPDTLIAAIARYAGDEAVVAWDRDIAPHLSGLFATTLHDGSDPRYGFDDTVRVYFSFEYPLYVVAGAAYKHRYQRWFWAEPLFGGGQNKESATMRLSRAIIAADTFAGLR